MQMEILGLLVQLCYLSTWMMEARGPKSRVILSYIASSRLAKVTRKCLKRGEKAIELKCSSEVA